MLSWISREINIILLVKTWEHEESKVHNIEEFVLWSTWNNKSYYREFGGTICYTNKDISPHIWLLKIDPLNQYSWIEISNINAKNIYIAICYFTPIDSTFYKKKYLDKNFPYNSL